MFQLPQIENGMIVHGLFSDAFRFDVETMQMVSEHHRVINEAMPMLHMEPKMDFVPPKDDYMCPLYKTGARAGLLSTTGSVDFYGRGIVLRQGMWASKKAGVIFQ